jgi:cytochrome c
MTSIKSAAEFIHANMPLGLAGTLSVQQAWGVAAYIDSQVRPLDPRFTGDVAENRKKHHDTSPVGGARSACFVMLHMLLTFLAAAAVARPATA